MAINTMMSGKEIDRNLSAVCDLLKLAEDPENDNKVVYIRRGTQAIENGTSLFDVMDLT